MNWFEHTERAILSRFPWATPYGRSLVVELSCLFLERLPPRLGQALLVLLPDQAAGKSMETLNASIPSVANLSIDYPQFIQRTQTAFLSVNPEAKPPEWTKTITDAFLWAIAQELPADIKSELRDILPPDLRNRMNLNAVQQPESRVG